jgi:hypothetical protein
MAASGGRSVLASIVGWILVAIIVYVFFGWILATIGFVIRMVLFVIVIGALLSLYLRLRGD